MGILLPLFMLECFIVVLEGTTPQNFLASLVKSHVSQLAEYGKKKVLFRGEREEDCLKISAYILPFSGAFLKFFLKSDVSRFS